MVKYTKHQGTVKGYLLPAHKVIFPSLSAARTYAATPLYIYRWASGTVAAAGAMNMRTPTWKSTSLESLCGQRLRLNLIVYASLL